jgi:hypothetical protein
MLYHWYELGHAGVAGGELLDKSPARRGSMLIPALADAA